MGKKRFHWALAFMALGAFFLIFGLSGAQAKTFVLKHGHVGSVDDEDQHAGLVFKDFVETLSKGRIKVELYPAAQLGSFREQLESVALGTQEMTLTTCGGAANMFPEIQVTDIPYMFPDDRVAEKVFDGPFTEKLRAYMFKKNPNVRLMMVSNTGGWRCFVTKNKPVKSPADMKGQKIRVIESDLHVNLVKAMGGTATPIPWAEVYTSLKTGVAEGSMNGITDVVNAKLHEVLKFITLDYHMYMSAFYFMNEKFYKSLPDDLKRIVLDGLYHLKWVSRDHVKRTGLDAYEVFKKAGGTIYVPTAAEKAQFIDAGKSSRDWFIGKYGKEWVDILEKAVKEGSDEVEKERKKEM